jgi:hypothetical protein
MATLILSVYDPDRVPYLSDELDRYINWNEAMKEDRYANKSISHTIKEYNYSFEEVDKIRS